MHTKRLDGTGREAGNVNTRHDLYMQNCLYACMCACYACTHAYACMRVCKFALRARACVVFALLIVV